TDRGTFRSGAQHGSAEAAVVGRRYSGLSAYDTERRTVVEDSPQQHVAGRADVRFRNTANILQPTLFRIVRTFSRNREGWVPSAGSPQAPHRAWELRRRSGSIRRQAQGWHRRGKNFQPDRELARWTGLFSCQQTHSWRR